MRRSIISLEASAGRGRGVGVEQILKKGVGYIKRIYIRTLARAQHRNPVPLMYMFFV